MRLTADHRLPRWQLSVHRHPVGDPRGHPLRRHRDRRRHLPDQRTTEHHRAGSRPPRRRRRERPAPDDPRRPGPAPDRPMRGKRGVLDDLREPRPSKRHRGPGRRTADPEHLPHVHQLHLRGKRSDHGRGRVPQRGRADVLELSLRIQYRGRWRWTVRTHRPAGVHRLFVHVEHRHRRRRRPLRTKPGVDPRTSFLHLRRQPGRRSWGCPEGFRCRLHRR